VGQFFDIARILSFTNEIAEYEDLLKFFLFLFPVLYLIIDAGTFFERLLGLLLVFPESCLRDLLV